MNQHLIHKLFVLLALTFAMFGCGGGGGGGAAAGGGGGGGVAATKAVLTVSLQGTLAAGTSIGAAEVTVILPAGVTAKADTVTGETGAGVVVVSGNAAGSEILAAKYTAASATAPGTIKIGFAKTTGFQAGECLTLNLDITGAVPSVTGFGTTGLGVFDTNSTAIGGMAAALTLQLI